VRRILAVPDEQIEAAATVRSGAEVTAATAGERRALQTRGDHAALHELAELERVGGQGQAAITLLRAHLARLPGCVGGATELARILHGLQRFEEAYAVLRPGEGVPGLPAPTVAWLAHLRAHLARQVETDELGAFAR
jgi:hypothetical protein